MLPACPARGRRGRQQRVAAVCQLVPLRPLNQGSARRILTARSHHKGDCMPPARHGVRPPTPGVHWTTKGACGRREMHVATPGRCPRQSDAPKNLKIWTCTRSPTVRPGESEGVRWGYATGWLTPVLGRALVDLLAHGDHPSSARKGWNYRSSALHSSLRPKQRSEFQEPIAACRRPSGLCGKHIRPGGQRVR